MLDKKYDHKLVEEGKYEKWLKNGYFASGDKEKIPYTIVIPPPNVTGKLHLGHAWDTTLQDVLIRYKRMQGFDCLWLPGMDHAGIATQAKVDKKLKEAGIEPRSLKREEWLKKAFEWKEEYAKNIHAQWAKLGLSLDYNKERFTLDDGLSKAVRKVFVDLYNKGLIYRGERIINWDPEAKTALSKEEVINKDDKGAFYHLKYYVEGSETEYIRIATTRPETLFGDTAVAVNPSDKRYQKYIGKNVFIPLVNRPIPVIADEHADPEFGTGAVKITPAHDSNDFEVGLRHHLEKIIVINPDGTMNHYAEKYEGMDRFLCREKLVEDLQKQDFLLQVEPIIHSVGHSERTDAVIEPYLSKQWFVKMRPLADQVLENQKNKETKVNFVPTRYEKIMNHWMEITYDWCISRQLWWGHRIPAWYKGEEIYVGMEAPQEEGWRQDKDVLDTWFSSALWPFSTLGWPLNTEDFQRYYPTDCLVTGYDIIPFWVNRMTFQGLEFTGLRPFKDCLIHGLIRDKEGRKFSKSLGNGVDPMDMIELYGADALRYYLATVASNGTDIRFDEEKIKATWNFINKLWNASRFVLINALEKEVTPLEKLKKEDKWILTKLNKTIKDVTKFMNKYEFNNVGNILYDFIWTDFCDKYIELAKYTLNDPLTKTILVRVLATILKMLHPFMPYVTDEIYSRLCATEKNIAVSDYPIFEKTFIFEETAQEIEDMFEFIKIYRNIKAENKITNDFKIKWENASNYDLISKLLKIENQVTKEALSLPSYKVKSVLFEATIYYEKKWSNEEIEGLKKEIELIEKSIERRKKLLANTNYVEKAPQKLVEEERQKLQREEEKLKVLQMELK